MVEDTEYNEFLDGIKDLVKHRQTLARQAVASYGPMVDDIILTQSRDSNHIERTLTYMLDFCFADEMLLLFKKLCRYYWEIDAHSTAFYINSYRDMWDEGYQNEELGIG